MRAREPSLVRMPHDRPRPGHRVQQLQSALNGFDRPGAPAGNVAAQRDQGQAEFPARCRSRSSCHWWWARSTAPATARSSGACCRARRASAAAICPCGLMAPLTEQNEGPVMNKRQMLLCAQLISGYGAEPGS